MQHPEAGHYYVNFGSPVSGHVVEATDVRSDTDGDHRGAPIVSICGGGTEGSQCAVSDNTGTVWVLIYGPQNMNNQDHAFYVAVF